MTKLSTHLNIETIKQSKALQGIECETSYWSGVNELDVYVEKMKYVLTDNYICPAPTIANVIDNAEMLFGERVEMHSKRILKRCFENKSIEDISSYILKNLKNN